MRRIFTMLAALVIALGTITAATPTPTRAAAGLCTQPSVSDKIFIAKRIEDAPSGSSFFDGVKGIATVRILSICIDTGIGGGTYVLPANIENIDNGKIFQLGYGRSPGNDTRWVYADGTPAAKWKSSSACPPVPGNTITFTITRVNSLAQYSINDLTDNCGISWNSTEGLGTGMDLTWWGVERNDQSSSLGPDNGSGTINMHHMGYNVDTSVSWIYRTDLLNQTNGPNETNPNKIFERISGGDSSNKYRGSISSHTWTNDQLNVNTY